MAPNHPVYYGRAHWAIENLLSQPEFKALQWTSLQPNFFTVNYLASAVDWVKKVRQDPRTKPGPLAVVPDADVAVAMIDPEDVGAVGAHLLALADPSSHNGQRYVLSGPDDVTGKDIVEAAERYAGQKATEIEYKSVGWLHDMIDSGAIPKKVLPSIMAGFEPLWSGKCTLVGTPTSKPVVELAAPRRTITDAMDAMLN